MKNSDTKKPYVAPKLVTHGNVENLTGQSGARKLSGQGGESGNEERPFRS